MTEQEAQEKALKLLWVVEEYETLTGWRALIKPAVEIKFIDDTIEFEEGFPYYICGSGSLTRDIAAHIVKVHNEHVYRMAMANTILNTEGKNIKEFYENHD